MDNQQRKEQMKQFALDGFKQGIDTALAGLNEAMDFKKVLEGLGFDTEQLIEHNLIESFWNAVLPEFKDDRLLKGKITRFESVVLNILAAEGKQMFAIDITIEFNKITGKNYSRRNMSSSLAKMESKGLIRSERIKKGNITKYLWYLPKWEDEEGLIKKEYLKNDM